MHFRDYLYIANWYTIRINCIWYCLLYHIFNCKKMTNANDFSYFHKFMTSEMIKIRSILRDLIHLYLYLLIETIIIQFFLKIFLRLICTSLFFLSEKNSCIPYITGKNINISKTFVIVHDIIHPSTSQYFYRNIGKLYFTDILQSPIQSVPKCNPILSIILTLS